MAGAVRELDFFGSVGLDPLFVLGLSGFCGLVGEVVVVLWRCVSDIRGTDLSESVEVECSQWEECLPRVQQRRVICTPLQ